MRLYNTLTRKVEELKTNEPNKIKMYICGPTVYNAPTLGNLRTYISEDILRRTLEFLGYQVEETMNITDIEDKIIRDSKAQGIKFDELTAKYEKIFLENLKALNIEEVEHTPHATNPKVIAKMVEVIESLLEKGFAYISEDGSVYFSIDKYDNYGKLSGLENREVKAGARVAQDEYEKENAQDFALWKAAKDDEPSWDGPKGIKGRPGWHIECTAMSIMTLGETIDIHGGGIDLIFPHHENEIAQSEAYTDKKFVNTWFHTGHLLINGQRMGKSLGNFYTLDDLVEKFNVNPLVFRLLCLQAHYRDSLNFTENSINDSYAAYDNLVGFSTRLNTFNSTEGISELEKLITELKENFKNSLSDDLNTPKALASVFDFINTINKAANVSKSDAKMVKELMVEIDSVLGLNLESIRAKAAFVIEKVDIATKVVSNNADIDEIFFRYRHAKENRNFVESDKLRDELNRKNWNIEDGKTHYILRKTIY